MAKVIVGMTTSLDGFVADERGDLSRLYPDLDALRGTDHMNAMVEATGAVLMGRRTFEVGDPDWYVGNYEFQVPIFVVTHQPPPDPPKQDEHLTFTFVTDGVEAAVAQAVAAAGDKRVQVVGGADLSRQLLLAGLVDELHVDVMPVLLGAGLRLFDQDLRDVQLQSIDTRQIGERISLRFAVTNEGRAR